MDLLNVRHKGLMFGIEFSAEVAPFITALRKNGLIVLSAGPNVIRLLPPLTVTYEEMEKALQIIGKTILENNQITC